MALVFVDGFDPYGSNADLAGKWDVLEDLTDNIFEAAGGRFGGGCIALGDDDEWLIKYIPLAGTAASTDELFVGFSVKFGTLASVANSVFLLLSNTGTTGSTISDDSNVNLRFTGNVLQLRRQNTVLTTGTFEFQTGVWYRIEVKLVVGNSGLAQVRVNGTLDIDFSGDTYNSGTAGVRAVQFGHHASSTSSLQTRIDDVVVWTSAGAAPTSWLGDLRIQTLLPNADGDTNNGTPSSGSDHYAMVDEAGAPDGDSTYVSAGTAGDIELYGIQNLGVTPDAVHAVALNLQSRTDGTTPRKVAPLAKSGATQGEGVARDVPMGAAYKTSQSIFTENPDTSAAWTGSQVDAAQFGWKVAA